MEIRHISKTDVAICIGKDDFDNDIWIAKPNNPQGRTELSAECPPELVAEVLAAWGDTPTMPDAPTLVE